VGRLTESANKYGKSPYGAHLHAVAGGKLLDWGATT
jgi:hypothetical protein